jgi:hypothetical protein
MSTANSLQTQYKELIIKKNFTALARLVEQNENFPPAENIVRLGFKTYLHEAGGSKVKLFYLMKLKEITSIKPDQGVVKDACEIALSMNSPEVLEALVNRTEASKSVFRELNAPLQKNYQKYINEGRFVDIAKLLEVTGIAPAADAVQKGYAIYLQEAKFISFSGLKKRTGIQPDKEMVEEVYRHYQGNYFRLKSVGDEQATIWMDRLRKLRKISKIDPPEDVDIEEPEEEEELE